jgi:ribonuclease HI
MASGPKCQCPHQGMGVYGAVAATCSFRLLRAAFQSLESALGRAGLSTSHVKGHSGDAWNDLVDLLAKQERVKFIQDSPFVLPHFFWCPARWFDIS